MQLKPDLPEKRYLTQEDIETILKFLESGKRYVCRGRGGYGLSLRENIYYVHWFEEFDDEATPYTREDFIKYLKNLDLHTAGFGYWNHLLNKHWWR